MDHRLTAELLGGWPGSNLFAVPALKGLNFNYSSQVQNTLKRKALIREAVDTWAPDKGHKVEVNIALPMHMICPGELKRLTNLRSPFAEAQYQTSDTRQWPTGAQTSPIK